MENLSLFDCVLAYATSNLVHFLSGKARKSKWSVNAVADYLGITPRAYRDLRHKQDSRLWLKIITDIASNNHSALAIAAYQKWCTSVLQFFVYNQAPVMQVPPDCKQTALLRLCLQGRISPLLYATLATLDELAPNITITLTASPTFFNINDTRCTDDDVMRVNKIIIKGNIDL